MAAPPCQDSAVSELSLNKSVQRKHPAQPPSVLYRADSQLKKQLHMLRVFPPSLRCKHTYM